MDYKVIKWIAEQYNPKQSKGNLCNPSAIHCNLGLQFGFAIQSNLCNPTAMQEDCSLIVEIAVWLLRLQKFRNIHIQLVNPTACRWLQSPQSNCNLRNPTAICAIQLQCRRIAVWLWRLQSDCWDCKSSATYIYSWSIPRRVGDCNLHNPTAISAIQLQSPQSNCNLCNPAAMQEDCSLIMKIAVWLLRLQSDCWDCSLIAEIAVWLLRLQSDCWDCCMKQWARRLRHSGMWTSRGKFW